jgi:hypothetical protein
MHRICPHHLHLSVRPHLVPSRHNGLQCFFTPSSAFSAEIRTIEPALPARGRQEHRREVARRKRKEGGWLTVAGVRNGRCLSARC